MSNVAHKFIIIPFRMISVIMWKKDVLRFGVSRKSATAATS